MAQLRFEATVIKRGAALCFSLPERVSERISHSGRVPISGSINSYPVHTSLFPDDGGGHFMMVGKEVQRFIGARAGDTLRVILDVRREGGAVQIPLDLERALARSEAAMRAFSRLSPSHQREYVDWIEEAKRPETRARRIEKTVERLDQSP